MQRVEEPLEDSGCPSSGDSLQSQAWLPIAFCVMPNCLGLALRADFPQVLHEGLWDPEGRGHGQVARCVRADAGSGTDGLG